MNAPPLLKVDGLVVGYSRPLLRPLDLELREGEIVGIWGPNGIGKTTLLSTLLGEVSALRGTLRRRPGCVLASQPQRPVRLPEMPIAVGEYLDLLDTDRRFLPERLRARLDGRIDRLSGGQYQLLSIYAVAASPAHVVLLDEPTNNLDPDNLASLVELLEQLREGRAFVLVSHERPVLERLCTRILDVTPDGG